MPTPELDAKSFGAFEIKDADAGEVAAIVATLGVVDRDGDVLLPGSFPPSAKVAMSGYAHDVIADSAMPVGKGIITVEGDKAIFRGRFFMSTDRGREAFHTVKELAEDSEWSFGFPKNVKTAPMTAEWRAKGARRLVAGLLPVEASPVFIGAGINTGTLFTKEADEIPDPAIETARIKAEEDAAAERVAIEAKSKADAINAAADRMFKRSPVAVR